MTTYFQDNADKIREIAAECGSLSEFWRRSGAVSGKPWPDFQSCLLANEELNLGFETEHTIIRGNVGARPMPKSELPVVGKKRPAAKKAGGDE